MKTEDPQEEISRLRAYYAECAEEELQRLGSQYESLTEAAQTAIRAEFDRRGMPAPILAESEDLEFQSLVTIQQFRDSADAWLAKSALESAGIFAFLRDENTVRVHWGWSNAVGGIRLQVRPEDEAAAEEVLSQPIQSAIESEGVEYEQPRCPYCQSLDIDFESVNPKVGLASIIIAVPIPWPQKLWTCNTCGKKWNDQLGADG
jgi:Putative prokaryotic signal transducing protein